MITHLTWDGDGESDLPRRPTVDDVGGDQKVDSIEHPPNPVEHPTADGWNQKAKQIPALGRVVGACKICIEFDAGAPFVESASACGTAVAASTFTVEDNGAGDVSVTWPANTFPLPICRPTGLTVFSAGATRVSGQVEVITNGVRVRTFNASDVATDAAWSLEIN